jgi:hypothetical protein
VTTQVAIETIKLTLSTIGGIIAALLIHRTAETWLQDFMSISPLAPITEAISTWPVYVVVGLFSAVAGPLIVPPLGISPSYLAMLGVAVTGVLRLFVIVRSAPAIARTVVVWIPCIGMWGLLYSIFWPAELKTQLLETRDTEGQVVVLFLVFGSLVVLHFVEQLGKMRRRPSNPE